jgi:hypothetical protein
MAGKHTRAAERNRTRGYCISRKGSLLRLTQCAGDSDTWGTGPTGDKDDTGQLRRPEESRTQHWLMPMARYLARGVLPQGSESHRLHSPRNSHRWEYDKNVRWTFTKTSLLQNSRIRPRALGLASIVAITHPTSVYTASRIPFKYPTAKRRAIPSSSSKSASPIFG